MKRSRPESRTPAAIEQRLRERNVQPTAQRIAICCYLLGEADPRTADDMKR
jgi:Fur family iron response transcriptional regulator